jgi:hypothetical protein
MFEPVAQQFDIGVDADMFYTANNPRPAQRPVKAHVRCIRACPLAALRRHAVVLSLIAASPP